MENISADEHSLRFNRSRQSRRRRLRVRSMSGISEGALPGRGRWGVSRALLRLRRVVMLPLMLGMLREARFAGSLCVGVKVRVLLLCLRRWRRTYMACSWEGGSRSGVSIVEDDWRRWCWRRASTRVLRGFLHLLTSCFLLHFTASVESFASYHSWESETF